jgi:hypothetical protein
MCVTCKQFCLLSAVGCECDNYRCAILLFSLSPLLTRPHRVSCVKDAHLFCKCPINKKFLMSECLPLSLSLSRSLLPPLTKRSADWVTRDEIRQMLFEMRDIINLSKRKAAMASEKKILSPMEDRRGLLESQ